MLRRLAIAAALITAAPAGAQDVTGSARFRELESVKAFDQVMETLAGMREMILTDAIDEREAAEGMRFLLRVVSMAQDVSGDAYPPAPHFARMDTPRRKVGGDNPNAEYDSTAWDGRRAYRIRGNIGTVDHVSFTVMARPPDGPAHAIGYVNERSLEPDARGDFTLWLAAEKPEEPGVWIRTAPEQRGSVLVRQYIGDRAAERLASYSIDVVGRSHLDPLAPSSDAEVAAAIRATLNGLNGLGRLHHYVSPSIEAEPNRFERKNSDDFGAEISGSDNLYMIGTYRIEPDEALIVEVAPLDVRYWNFAIENPWHESVDYAQRKTARTHDDVTRDPDGKVRFVIAHARTDHPNWLETAGHRRGFMTFRWVGERQAQAPLPTVTKLPLAEAVARASALGGR